jgi:hypothetical protein
MKIMTWNCLGMTDHTKRQKLSTYMTTETIALVFLQEGDQNFDNAETEAYSGPSVLLLGGADTTEKAILTAFNADFGVSSVGGVSRSAYYNIVADTNVVDFAKLAETGKVGVGGVDYLRNDAIKDYVLEPAKTALAKREMGGKHLLVFESGRSRSGFKDAGKYETKERIQKLIRDPVQHRMNLMGHRRPKAITINGTNPALTIYYWHAPLGQDLKLEDVGFEAYKAIRNEGCNGEVAIAANILFAKHLGVPTTGFPDNVILVGDLNISSAAVEKIYDTDNILTSNPDGWCHAVAGKSPTLTLVSDTLDQLRLGYSDHAPVVFTIP